MSRKKLSEKDWDVVVHRPYRGAYSAVFRVGCQFFTLAETTKDSYTTMAEAKDHCELIAKMFVVALGNLGIDVTGQPRHLRVGSARTVPRAKPKISKRTRSKTV